VTAVPVPPAAVDAAVPAAVHAAVQVVRRGPDRLLPHLLEGAATVLVVVAIGLVMRRSWRRRARAQSDLPPPAAPPGVLPADLLAPAGGLYVGTVLTTGWLERVAAHGLGARARTTLRVTEGGVALALPRGDVWVPAADLRGGRLESSLAGKVVGVGGLLVLRWALGPAEVDTGIRLDERTRTDALLAAVAGLVPPRHPTTTDHQTETDHLTEESPVPTPPPLTAVPLTGTAEPTAVLVLEDGRSWRGQAFGALGQSVGEAVFATGMTGYQETLTDPSYHRQVVVATAPQIGNTGINDEDDESGRIWVAGYVVRDPSRLASSWRSRRTLGDELRAQGVVGLAGVDTRAITRHLRERGAMRCILSSPASGGDDIPALLERVRASPPMAGLELASQVSTRQPYMVPAVGQRRFRVAALDLGIKRRTPWHLARRGIETHVLPATSTAEELLAIDPDGVFVSNGPGDPAAATYAHEALRGVLGRRVPVFGICMGNQVLGHALGLGTYKLRYGHRGINSPVLDRATGRVLISSHNHGFAVDAPLDHPVDTPFGRVEVSHVGLNDQVVEGLRCLDVPAFSVQFHPEAAAGPHDAASLFDAFLALLQGSARATA